MKLLYILQLLFCPPLLVDCSEPFSSARATGLALRKTTVRGLCFLNRFELSSFEIIAFLEFSRLVSVSHTMSMHELTV